VDEPVVPETIKRLNSSTDVFQDTPGCLKQDVINVYSNVCKPEVAPNITIPGRN